MKFSSLSKWLGTGLLAAGLAVLPLTLPAQAQDTTTETYVEPDGDVEEAETEDNFDWGWLGLLGLAGLAGLAKKERHEDVHRVRVDPTPDGPDVMIPPNRPGSDFMNDDPNLGTRSGTDYRR